MIVPAMTLLLVRDSTGQDAGTLLACDYQLVCSIQNFEPSRHDRNVVVARLKPSVFQPCEFLG